MPFAWAPPPRRERRGSHGDDPGEVIACAAEVRPRRVLGAGGDELAGTAVVAGSGAPVRRPHADGVEALLEPVHQRGQLLRDLDGSLACDPVHEVGPHHAERFGATPACEAQHRDPDRFELERVGAGGATAPELELAQLLRAIRAGDGQVDPPTDPHAPCR